MYSIFTRVLDQQGIVEGLEAAAGAPGGSGGGSGDVGLSCPLTFTPILTDSYKHADRDLLAWLKSERASALGLCPACCSLILLLLLPP